MNKNVNTKSISNLKESKVDSRNSDFKSNLIIVYLSFMAINLLKFFFELSSYSSNLLI